MDSSGDGALLGEAAKFLYGDDWHAQLAEQLSTRPPERPKNGIAPSLVWEWASGRARPPLWVMQAMAQFVIESVEDDGVRSLQLKTHLSQLNAAIQKAADEGWDGRGDLRIIIVNPEDSLRSEMVVGQSDDAAPIGPGVSATWKVPFAKAFGFPQVIEISLTIAAGVPIEIAVKLIAEWLIGQFRGRSDRLTINTRECTFDGGELKKIVEETITYERK